MKNPEFQKLVDQQLSRLQWDQQERCKVFRAISKEEKSMKKISKTLIPAAILLCFAVSAMAAGLVFSKKVNQDVLAEKALLEKYGITTEMLTFFTRTNSEKEGTHLVSYDADAPFDYVLGNYTVTIKDNTAEVLWSRDGAETDKGFESEAWGADQLEQMLHTQKDNGTLSLYGQKAMKITEKNHAVTASDLVFDEASILENHRQQQRNTLTAQSKAKLSVPEMEILARDALILRYHLTQEQSSRLTCEADNGWYLLFGDKNIPCYQFYFSLSFSEDDLQDRKAGIYTVKVNVENGIIEDILYDSALGGNG